jgi:hypothetical protein
MTWIWSFRVLSIIIAVLAMFNFLLLIDSPKRVNIVIEVPEAEEVLIEDNDIEEEDQKPQSLKEIADSKNNMTKIQFKSSLSVESSKLKFSKNNHSDTYEDVKNDLLSEEQKIHMKSSSQTELTKIEEKDAEEEAHAIGFWKAWLIPGVIPFAICIAFVK